MALLTNGQPELHYQINNFYSASTRFALKISTSKTEVQCIATDPPIIKVQMGDAELNQVEHFTYLGSVMS